MKHATLYRKWRPRAFSGIVGQEPVVRTLRRAIETDRVAHAYLFSGPRGTGKTSTAKVLAMGLNCEQGPTPEPDGTCESCRAIVNNSSMDVLEMDAASNRGIDEIRELRDKVNLAPASGRMKVYIIDEVHMLTTEAFNALLKMLEEPPEHVVFVLATTEKHKVLPTIISRCQSFDFRRPSVETLTEKLKEISTAEGIEAEPEALTVIAREGRGSFRDAEGLLDQLSSFAEGGITAAMVRELLGSAGPEALLETTYALHERRAADALRVVDRLSNEGKDLGQFVSELLAHLRNLMLLPHAPEIALAEVGANERPALEEQANAVPTAEVVRLVEALGVSVGGIKRGGDPKLELELTFLKLARDYTEPDVDVLLRRLEALEHAAENGGLAPRSAPAVQAPSADPSPVTSQPVEETSIEASDPALPEEREAEPEPVTALESGGEPDEPSRPEQRDAPGGDAHDLAAEWGGVMQALKNRRQALTAAVYGEARVESFDGSVLKIYYPPEQSFHVNMAKDNKHLEELGKVLEEKVGSKPRVEVRAAGEKSAANASPPPVPDPAPEGNEPRGESRGTQERVRDDGPDAPEPAPPEARNEPDEEPPPEPRASNGAGGVESRAASRAAESVEGDDIIRDQREVFEMARKQFGLFGQDGGS